MRRVGWMGEYIRKNPCLLEQVLEDRSAYVRLSIKRCHVNVSVCACACAYVDVISYAFESHRIRLAFRRGRHSKSRSCVLLTCSDDSKLRCHHAWNRGGNIWSPYTFAEQGPACQKHRADADVEQLAC